MSILYIGCNTTPRGTCDSCQHSLSQEASRLSIASVMLARTASSPASCGAGHGKTPLEFAPCRGFTTIASCCSMQPLALSRKASSASASPARACAYNGRCNSLPQRAAVALTCSTLSSSQTSSGLRVLQVSLMRWHISTSHVPPPSVDARTSTRAAEGAQAACRSQSSAARMASRKSSSISARASSHESRSSAPAPPPPPSGRRPPRAPGRARTSGGAPGAASSESPASLAG
mmetsp:Transcript_54118/g.108699  ORF Transcript_54118/g.108699 Transcript_54118/m.108699 type:complete len:232 (-) Transcript_54118:54-749(-)